MRQRKIVGDTHIYLKTLTLLTFIPVALGLKLLVKRGSWVNKIMYGLLISRIYYIMTLILSQTKITKGKNHGLEITQTN
jgi:hypothetical protein